MRGDLNAALRHCAWAISEARSHYAARTDRIVPSTCLGVLLEALVRTASLLHTSGLLKCLT